MKHFGCVQNTPTCSVLVVMISSSNIPARSQLVVSSSVRAVFIFPLRSSSYDHFCFLCFCDVPASLTASPLPPVTHLQEAESRKEHSLDRSCQSHLWQAASLCRMFSLFPRSQHGCSRENTPECFMSPCRWQKIMTTHEKLARRGFCQKKEPRDEL